MSSRDHDRGGIMAARLGVNITVQRHGGIDK
jgi:hypothetical protein